MTTYPTRSRLARPAGRERNGLLRLSLRIDALASGALGLLALIAAPLLDEPLGAPLTLLVVIGPLLVAWSVSLWLIAARPDINRPAAWSVVLLNLLWVVASIAAVAADWFSLTALGTALLLVQAAAVALFADAQIIGLRRSQPATA